MRCNDKYAKMNFWIYLERELIDLQTDFEKIFSVNNLYHDYENVWEWIESSDRDSEIYLNISRPHDWKKGEYDKPIMIRVESRLKNLSEETIANAIKNEFRCNVFAGEISVDENDNSVIIEKRKY